MMFSDCVSRFGRDQPATEIATPGSGAREHDRFQERIMQCLREKAGAVVDGGMGIDRSRIRAFKQHERRKATSQLPQW